MFVNLRSLHNGVVVLTFLTAGCSGPSHPATAPVSGVVTYKGSSVDEAVVVFASPAGGRPATAITDGQGKFRLSTFAEYDGAMPGNYKVTVNKTTKDTSPPKSQEELNAEFERQQQTGQAPPPPVVQFLVPEKYLTAEKTPLEFTVKADKNEEAHFELTD
jgi:hypothetical protein